MEKTLRVRTVKYLITKIFWIPVVSHTVLFLSSYRLWTQFRWNRLFLTGSSTPWVSQKPPRRTAAPTSAPSPMKSAERSESAAWLWPSSVSLCLLRNVSKSFQQNWNNVNKCSHHWYIPAQSIFNNVIIIEAKLPWFQMCTRCFGWCMEVILDY